MPEKIGFVGVGRMGANMARRLKDCGYPIAAVYELNAAAAQALAQELGCLAADHLESVTQASEVVITVVSDDKAMKQIYRGGLLRGARGKLLINCATITPAVHGWVESKAAKAGAQSLEACMASSITQARQAVGAGDHALFVIGQLAEHAAKANDAIWARFDWEAMDRAVAITQAVLPLLRRSASGRVRPRAIA